MTAMGIFLLFGSLMACVAGTALVWRGTVLDRLWELNPRAYKELAPLGKVVGVPFVLLGVTLAVAGVGWFRHRVWGWRLAVAIIAAEILGNLVNAFRGRVVEGAVGVTIAGGLFLYLLRPTVRAVFEGEASQARNSVIRSG
jgi:hypothetical protein